jgi:2-methylisocitrate lyase-like PEP mutase family enzyme
LTDLPALRAAGLGPALDALEALMSAHAPPPGLRDRWHSLSLSQLLDHLRAHAEHVDGLPTSVDADSGYLEALHVAARALMVAARIMGG